MTAWQGSADVPKELRPAVGLCLRRYGDYDTFVKKLGIEKQSWLVANWQDDLICVPDDGNGHVLVPTVEIARHAFGYERVQAWLMSYIINLNSFLLGTNPDKKMTGAQMEEAAAVMMDNYGRTLFVTEIPLLFSRIKAGKYGKAYGVVDGGMVLNCVQQYLDRRPEEKAAILKEKERERWRREAEEDAKKPRMSLEEWRRTVHYAELQMQGVADRIDSFAEKFGCQIIGDGKQEDKERHPDSVRGADIPQQDGGDVRHDAAGGGD